MARKKTAKTAKVAATYSTARPQSGGSNPAKDKNKLARPSGWRMSAGGNWYYENRRNRSDTTEEREKATAFKELKKAEAEAKAATRAARKKAADARKANAAAQKKQKAEAKAKAKAATKAKAAAKAKPKAPAKKRATTAPAKKAQPRKAAMQTKLW